MILCVRLPCAGSGGFWAVQPLFLTNRSRRDRPPEMLSTPSLMPWMPMYAMGWLPPLHPLSTPPDWTATARNTFARAHAIA